MTKCELWMFATDFATDWRTRGACLAADPELFFPISYSGPALVQLEQAKSICTGCQVRQQCLDFALSTNQTHGVWGGTSPEERQSMRHRKLAMAGGLPGPRASHGRPGTAARSRPPRR
jgi:WhiB family transcriptional regulator, redox-sensing transcriptional regulator